MGTGENARTFWTQLGAATPELARHSADAIAARHARLTGAALAPPPVLEGWSRSAAGRFRGRLGERTVWVEASLEGRLDGDAGDGAGPGGFVEARGGRVFELGEAAAAPAADPVGAGGAAAAARRLTQVTAGGALALALLAAAAGFGAGTALQLAGSPPPPPPPLPAAARTIALPGAPTAPEPARTIGEQRQRLELKLARDKQSVEEEAQLAKMRAARLDLKVREDELRLGEIRRLEAERGSGFEQTPAQLSPAVP